VIDDWSRQNAGSLNHVFHIAEFAEGEDSPPPSAGWFRWTSTMWLNHRSKPRGKLPFQFDLIRLNDIRCNTVSGRRSVRLRQQSTPPPAAAAKAFCVVEWVGPLQTYPPPKRNCAYGVSRECRQLKRGPSI